MGGEREGKNKVKMSLSLLRRVVRRGQEVDRLTGFVGAGLAGDGESMDVHAEVPGHHVQEQYGKRPIGMVVVDQGVDLSRLQPVTGHIPLSVQKGPKHVR